MIKQTLTILILFISLLVNAQETITITGQIIDQETQETLPFVSISVNDEATNAIVTGTISDDNGRFEIKDLKTGKYIINITYLGFETIQRKIASGGLNPIFDLGKIELKSSAEALDEVTIEAKRATVNSALDKKSFSLTDNVAQSGGSVVDAMKTMPGVAFDQEGKVVLRGSDKVVVLIDGKQSSLTGFGNQKGLSNIPASNIERIEIINNPSAKYDANGFAGIVNIIYKKEKQTGLNGDVGLSFGLGALSKRKQDTPTDYGSFSVNPKLIPSLNLNYRTDKLNYFLQSEFIIQEALPNNEFTTRNYDDGRNIISQVPENRRQFRSIITGGVDWELSENDAITFSGMFDREKHIDTSQVVFINLDNNVRNRLYTWKEEEITSFINVAANYKHNFPQAGHSLSANAQYTRGLEDESYFLNDSSAVRVGRDMTNIRAIEHTTSLSTDYARALSSGKIEAGAKVRFRNLPVDYTINRGNESIIYPDLGSFLIWKENLYAFYGNYLLEKELFDVEAGLRAEQTDVSYVLDPQNAYYPSNDKYDYFELFPSLRFTYKLNDKNKLSLFYNRRVDRPGEPELRIFPKYDDPELLKVGNPYLRPQFTNSVEAAHRYNWGSGSLFSAIYHRQIKGAYQRIFSVDNSNPDYDIVNRIYQNTGESTNTGIELLFSQDLTENWKLTASTNIYRNSINAFEGTLLFPFVRPFSIAKSSDTAGDFKISNSFTLPYEIEAQVTGLYYSKRNIPQGEELARSSVDLGLKKSIWDKKGEITLSASDLFNNFGLRQRIKGEGFTALYENYYETQIVRLGMKYKF
ncbi:TonB-dependent receptor [Cellulophaga lytica]|uniref:TonB-dependent outer membrane receptor n=1 Tax=Cellulophaga geojensis KL-A TaxID=1328323 RepID=A0ABP3BA44_9FLAO|nr:MULTISPECIES: TonB-dependent receptor [Cellulophaga]APU11629.1 TonB-dependent receptor [Cellulophaga lytica]EWH14689.1 TonB-dependent outer membrane receptor [Cellulophaga geojensis KL-A]TVZ09935.1 outer membrane receptor protein involved in Fe transport [Cellulophaga sp. RHA_52]